MSLVEAFWRDGSTPAIRRLILDAAAERRGGVAEFQFNVFDVELNFDAGTVLVVDALTRDRTEVANLASFLARAAMYTEDPTSGDNDPLLKPGRTVFAVASAGTTERVTEPHPVEPAEEGIAAGTAWFGFYTNQLNVFAPPEGGPYSCPCCGHRTLDERGAYDICRTCGWEDDGQDDHDSDVVRGGPNGPLSLHEARLLYRAEGGRPGDHVIPSDPV